MRVRIEFLFLMGISVILFSSTSLASAEIEIDEDLSTPDYLTRPTFGVSHDGKKQVIDSGFKFNGNSFSINNNFHTPFEEQLIHIGKTNSFEVTTYSEKGLKVQEFLFGIPMVGESHLAELGIEVWFGYNGEIEKVRSIQKSNVIDEESLIAEHEKTKCQDSDLDFNCDTTRVSMIFLEPLKDKVMAIKAIDFKNRYQITYLNEGFEVTGASLNPMKSVHIPSPVKGEGLIMVTQMGKYSNYWISEDGRIFERNNFNSFKQTNPSFERFQDMGEPRTRLHSGFAGILDHEKSKAIQIFDANQLISDLPESFAYSFPEPKERITKELEQKMQLQEEIAKKTLEKIDRQVREY